MKQQLVQRLAATASTAAVRNQQTGKTVKLTWEKATLIQGKEE